MLRRMIFLALLPSLMAVGSGVSKPDIVEQLSKFQVLKLQNGPNEVDLDGDGRADLILVAWRENGNAHSYERFTFYRHGTEGEEHWQLVPFFNARDSGEEDSLRTLHGADCDLRSVIVLRKKHDSPVTIIVGDRDLGESFADPAKVTFVVYTLTRNDEGLAGWPLVYFKVSATIQGKSLHCDIHEAFASELGIH